MLVTGTFSEYPLSLLLEILQHKHETGVLEFSHEKKSGYLYLKNGEVKGCEVGTSVGAAALELANLLTDAPFVFRRLEPTDYARVVWQKKFGLSGLTEKAGIQVRAQTLANQIANYLQSAHTSIQLPLARVLNRLTFYIHATYRKFATVETNLASRLHPFFASFKVDLPIRDSISRKVRSQSPRVETRIQQRRDERPIQALPLNVPQPQREIRKQRMTLPQLQLKAIGPSRLAMSQLRACVVAIDEGLRKTLSSMDRRGYAVSQHLALQVRRALSILKKTLSGAQVTLHSVFEKVYEKVKALNLQQTPMMIREFMESDSSLEPLVLKNATSATTGGTTVDESSFRSTADRITQVTHSYTKRAAEYGAIAKEETKEFAADVLNILNLTQRIISLKIMNYSRETLTRVRNTSIRLPSFQDVAGSNISFGIVVVALIAMISLSIRTLLDMNQQHSDDVSTAEQNVVGPSKSKKAALNTNRGKRKRRNGPKASPN